MIVGIDLGTTNSLVGAYADGQVRLFENPFGSLLTPSIVGIGDDGAMLVGQAARDRLVTHPHLTVAMFKRWMGTGRETTLGGRRFRPEELSALVLRALADDVEAATGEKVTEAVISVPAYFSDAQRKATRAAGELAGFRVERTINEPTAAALAYGLNQRADGGRFVVLDLGGGTFDISVVEIFDGVVEVHATAGDNFLGGEDVLPLMRAAALANAGIDPHRLAGSEVARLDARLETAKRAVTASGRAEVDMRLDGRSLHWVIDDQELAKIVEPLVQRMRQPLERALRDARIRPEDLDEVVLVGGASRLKMVPQLVTRMFGRLPLRSVDPDQIVATGAALAAGLKQRSESLEEIVLTDVCPYTLGVEVSQPTAAGAVETGLFSPIIERNTTVPVSREEIYYPVHEKQEQVLLNVFQGESPLVANNTLLGALEVPLPLSREGNSRHVAVRFTYDINGLLHVIATPSTSNKPVELVLQQNPGLLSAEEVERRLQELASLRVHPRDQQENIWLIARSERLYAEHMTYRSEIQSALAEFRTALSSQDTRRINRAKAQLIRTLDSIDNVPA